MSFGLFGKITAVEGKREELTDILLAAANALEMVDGCLVYLIQISDEDPHSIWITEVWKSEDAHQASLSNEEVRKLILLGRPLIASMERLNSLQVLGGKGLPK